jgi:FkbM family methyltransferase
MKRGNHHAGLRVLYRVAAVPLVGYPLLLCWQKGWLPKPRSDATALLRDGRILQCQLADRTQRTMYLGLFEPGETRLLGRLLDRGDTFIDVGAHIGWFTTAAARCVGEAGQIVACEPYPSNAAMLKGNLALNDCKNVRVVEAALGSRPGTITLARAGGDSGGVTALDWARDGRVEVPMTTLDEIASHLSAVALMKVDVEGWEAHVLRGAAKTLSQTENVLIEINPAALRKAGSSPGEVFDLLRRAGFTRFIPVGEGGLRRLHRSAVSNALATRSE